MPYPAFSKSGMTTLTFSRGNLFPASYTEDFSQIVAESEAGLVRVSTLRPPVVFHGLHFERLPLADFTALKAWLRNSLIRGRAFTFTYTDTAGTAKTVRWWQDTLDMPHVASGLYSVDLLLREETPAW